MTTGRLEYDVDAVDKLIEQVTACKVVLHEIMRRGTTQDGNTAEATIAYETLAYLEGERTLEDLRKVL